MRFARFAIIIVGILLPYAARLLPGSGGNVWSYVQDGVFGILLLQAFNVIAWGSIWACSVLYRHPAALLGPSILGFGYVGWGHYVLDFSADAQAAVGIAVIPLYALPYIAAGAVGGYVFDRWWRCRNAA
jgi:hypothetical protein